LALLRAQIPAGPLRLGLCARRFLRATEAEPVRSGVLMPMGIAATVDFRGQQVVLEALWMARLLAGPAADGVAAAHPKLIAAMVPNNVARMSALRVGLREH